MLSEVFSTDNVSIWELIFGLVLGLVGSYLWASFEARRTREKLVFAKSTRSRFDLTKVDKAIAANLGVSYAGTPIKSVSVFLVKIANLSRRGIANQSATIVFSENAQILKSEIIATEEEKRFIQEDSSLVVANQKRYILGLLPRNTEITIEFTVLDHDHSTFQVQCGMLPPDDERAVAGFQTSVDVQVSIIESEVVDEFETNVNQIATLFMFYLVLSVIPYPLSIFVVPIQIVLLILLVRALSPLASRIVRTISDQKRGSQEITVHGDFQGLLANSGDGFITVSDTEILPAKKPTKTQSKSK